MPVPFAFGELRGVLAMGTEAHDLPLVHSEDGVQIPH